MQHWSAGIPFSSQKSAQRESRLLFENNRVRDRLSPYFGGCRFVNETVRGIWTCSPQQKQGSMELLHNELREGSPCSDLSWQMSYNTLIVVYNFSCICPFFWTINNDFNFKHIKYRALSKVYMYLQSCTLIYPWYIVLSEYLKSYMSQNNLILSNGQG